MVQALCKRESGTVGGSRTDSLSRANCAAHYGSRGRGGEGSGHKLDLYPVQCSFSECRKVDTLRCRSECVFVFCS